jgi:hypothetical protein
MCLPPPISEVVVSWYGRMYSVQDFRYARLQLEELMEGLDWMSPTNWTINFHFFEHFIDQVERWGPVRDSWMFLLEDFFGYNKRQLKTRSNPVMSIMMLQNVKLCVAVYQNIIRMEDRQLQGLGACPPDWHVWTTRLNK